MTLIELYNSCEFPRGIRALSAYNGKVLCYRFKPDVHTELGEREVRNIFAAMLTDTPNTRKNTEVMKNDR